MQVVGKAKDGKEALSKLINRSADIALVDINMKGMGGVDMGTLSLLAASNK